MRKELYLVGGLMLFSFLGLAKSVRPPITGRTPTELSAIRPVITRERAGQPSQWIYQQTGDKTYKASVRATRLLYFSFPHNGGSVVTLTVRRRNDETHLYLSVSKGQFNNSFQGGKARIRFDNQPTVAYSFSAAANGTANTIFFDATQALVTKLKAARMMSIEVGFASQGQQSVAFNVAGLRWNP